MTRWPVADGDFRVEMLFGDRLVPCRAARPRSLVAMLARAAERQPDREALVCGAFRASWSAFASLVEDCARRLAARGVQAGDRVILFLDNRAEFVVALFALARLGAITVPVGVRERAPGLRYIVDQSAATVILYEPRLAELIPSLPIAVALHGDDPAASLAAIGAPASSAPEHEPDGEDTALIMYTSGTTGHPKGAIVTHLGLVHVGLAYAGCMDLTDGDRSACVVPLSHITGITATVCAMAAVAGTMIVVPQFDAVGFVTLAAAERMTHTLLVPAMYNLILARVDPGSHDLSAWRIGAFGGAPMPVSTIERIAAALPGLRLMNCYGATETTGAVTVMPADRLRDTIDSVGWPTPGSTLTVMDARGVEVPAGEVGELWISGPGVSAGYWRNPEATAANFVAGYWRSGDLGSVDANGFVRLHDRLKDMINRGGYKIFSAEVEDVLARHPAVMEAAVVAKPCPILGERIHAFVSVREGHRVAADALSEHCSGHLTDYKVPETYTLSWDPLPRNLNGKVLKAELRRALPGS